MTRAHVGWLVVFCAVSVAVAKRGDIDGALVFLAVAIAIPAWAWYYKRRNRGKTNNE